MTLSEVSKANVLDELQFMFATSNLRYVSDETEEFSESEVRVGTTVSWKYGTGTATGKVVKIYRDRITLKLGDSEITRNGSSANPALLIKQENGARALKLVSEVKISTSDYAEEVTEEIDPADIYTERATFLAAPIFSEWLEKLEDHLFTDVADLSEVRSRINSAYPKLDGAAFAELMSQVLFTSYSAGRYQVIQEDDSENETIANP